MTLSTDVYILDPVDPAAVFRYCQELLTRFDGESRPAAAHRWEQRDSWLADDARLLENLPGQQLPAWLMVHYRDDGPLVTEQAAAEHDEDCEPDCDGAYHTPAHWIDVDFDTSYGYSGPNGMGCGDLHAALVGLLGEYLTGHGVRWLWRNEYTGVIHDNPESLIELVADGFAGTAWFRGTVLPAITGLTR